MGKIGVDIRIPGKRVRVKNLPQTPEGHRLLEVIKEVCSQPNVAVMYTRLDFECVNIKSRERLSFHAKVDLNNPEIIVLNFGSIYAAIKKSDDAFREISDIIVHEITHLDHKTITPKLQESVARVALLEEEIERDKKSLLGVDSNAKRRMMAQILIKKLRIFQEKVWFEGIADFKKHFIREMQLNENYFRRLNTTVYNKSKIMEESCNEFKLNLFDKDYVLAISGNLNKCTFYSGLDPFAYDSGFWIVYFILINDRSKSFRDLEKMGSAKFLRHYEMVSLGLGQTPLITLTSGAGKFDIRRAMKELLELKKKYVN